MSLNNEEEKIMAYILISKHRTNTLNTLYENGTLMPISLAKKSSIRPNHISNYLKQLKEHDLAICINEDMRKGRLYKLTDLGKKIAEEIKNTENEN